MSTAALRAHDLEVSPLDVVESGRGWLGVELRHLGALAAVAREGSFRRAAESLGYVQSAVSGQIAQLERAVGIRLVDRSSGSAGASLTVAGRSLLRHVDEILARFEAARIDLAVLAEGGCESVRLGVIEGVGERRLPGALAAFRERFPTGEVIIDESYGEEQNFARLARGEVDFVVAELPLPYGPFDHAPLERDGFVLLVSTNSPLASQTDPPSPEQLARLPLIQPGPTRQSDPLAARLREALIDQTPWLRPHTSAAAQALVGAGLGAAVLPQLAVNADDPLTVAIPVPHLIPPRTIVLARHREREYPPTAQGLANLIETHYREACQRPVTLAHSQR
jgi:DNA-binding transcriptional LysR family regulator